MEQNDLLILADGMNSDNDPTYQPANTYREAWNGILTSDGQNKFAFESVKGTSLSFTIPLHRSTQKLFQVIGWVSFIDYLIVLVANDDSAHPTDNFPGEIGKVTFNNSGVGTYVPLYYHVGLNFTKEHPIGHDQIIAKPENVNIRRVVWTDNYNPLRSLNVADQKLTTNVTSGNIENGKSYMVLTTAVDSFIIYNAVQYGPGRIGGPLGTNVFTGTATTTYTITGSVIVIEYIPIQSLNVDTVFTLGTILYKGWTGGNLLAGSYQYAYQLETSDGVRSNWSYLSLPIHLVTNVLPTSQSESYAKYMAIPVTSNTGKGIRLTIEGVDTIYQNIRVAFIRTIAEGVYADPEVFYTQPVNNQSSVDLVHYGTELTTKISFKELIAQKAALDLVKSIATTKNRLFLGNVGLAADPDFDLSATAQVKTIEYLMPSDLTGLTLGSTSTSNGNPVAVFGHGKLEDATLGNTAIYPDQWYEVAGDSTTYNAVLRAVGTYFKGVPGVATHTPTSANTRVIGAIRIQKYTGVYRNIRLDNDFADHKGMMASHYLKSYWGGETYRFGLVIWGAKGQPSFVKFLGDKVIPQRFFDSTAFEALNPTTGTTIGFFPRHAEYYSGSSQASLRVLGLKFSNINFNTIATAYGTTVANLPNFVKGFSIVRVPRDEQVYGQGTIFSLVVDDIDPTASRVQGTCQIGNDHHFAATAARTNNFYAFYCPEYFKPYKGRPNKSSGDYLNIVSKYQDVATTGDPGVGVVSNNHYVNKYYDPIRTITGNNYTDGTTNLLNEDRTAHIEHDAQGINSDGLPGLLYNSSKAAAFAPGLGGRELHGSDFIIVNTKNDETGGTGYGRFDDFDYHRSIINWVRPKSVLYGGNSATAKAANQYQYCGHFQPLDSGFMTYLAGSSGIANDIEVFGGDCFVTMFGFARMYKNDTRGNAAILQAAQGMVIPLECNLNDNWRGNLRSYNRDRTYEFTFADEGIYAADAPDVGYEEDWNNVDAHVGTEKQYLLTPKPVGFKAQARDEHLIVYSAEKVDGEIINSWAQFKLDQYKRIDGIYGPIVNIVARSSKLFYFQNKGVGYLPVFERALQDSAVGDVIQLGVSGILERFDEIDYYFGNQHQMGLMVTDEAMVWFDWRRKAMMRLGFGGDKTNMSVMKGLNGFFQTKFEEVENEVGSTIFNSDNPITGKGILSYYDPRYHIGMMVFKYNKTVGTRTIERDFTIAFDRYLTHYVSFFNINPSHIISHNGFLLMSREVRPTIVPNTLYEYGDEINDSGNLFLNINTYVSAGTPIPPSLDPNWIISGAINRVNVAWRGNICNFFGKVYPFSLTVALKSPDLSPVTYDNLEVGGNNNPFTDIFTSNNDGSASDVSIKTTNRNYKYFDGSWWFNLPLKNKITRLVDHYLVVKMQCNNMVNNSVLLSTNVVKRIAYIRSSFRKKQ